MDAQVDVQSDIKKPIEQGEGPYQNIRKWIEKPSTVESVESQLFGGMPFKWAAGFACLCLFSLFLGHWITLRGQETINTMQKLQQIQVIPAPAIPKTEVVPAPAIPKTESSKESSLKVDHALGMIADSLDGTSHNINKLVDAVNIKFAKVQEQISVLGSKIEAMPKGNAPVDLTDIKTALVSLHNTMADNRNVDVIASSIKETSQRQDLAFRQLINTVAELQKTVKDGRASVDRDEFGTLLPPPRFTHDVEIQKK